MAKKSLLKFSFDIPKKEKKKKNLSWLSRFSQRQYSECSQNISNTATHQNIKNEKIYYP